MHMAVVLGDLSGPRLEGVVDDYVGLHLLDVLDDLPLDGVNFGLELPKLQGR